MNQLISLNPDDSPLNPTSNKSDLSKMSTSFNNMLNIAQSMHQMDPSLVHNF